MKYKKIKKYEASKFKRIVGIERILFEILRIALKEKHKKGVRKLDLKIECILLMTLTYYRDYPTFLVLGKQYNLDESNAFR